MKKILKHPNWAQMEHVEGTFDSSYLNLITNAIIGFVFRSHAIGGSHAHVNLV